MAALADHWALLATIAWIGFGVVLWRSLSAARRPVVAPSEEDGLVEGSSLWRDAWRRLLKHRMGYLGGLFTYGMVLICLFGPWILRQFGITYDAQDLAFGAQPGSLTPFHPFGTDLHGRDLLSRTLYGGRVSMAVGLVAALVSVVIGVSWGAVAGFVGGRVDRLMMRFVDVLYTLPYMILVILLMVIFEKSIILLFAAIGAVSWLTLAIITRGLVISLKNREFVEAARAIGVPSRQIIFRHLVPNALGPVIVYSTLIVPRIMLAEAFLSFLGLGVQPPRSSWGLLANAGAEAMSFYPWLLFWPGLFLALTLFAMNFLGDGLRDALDPQMRSD
jgi:oligopeptide transport system permease protein